MRLAILSSVLAGALALLVFQQHASAQDELAHERGTCGQWAAAIAACANGQNFRIGGALVRCKGADYKRGER